MFRASIATIIRVQKTVVAASGTYHTIWGASFFKRDQIRTASPYFVTFEETFSPYSVICTRGCNYCYFVLRVMGAMDARKTKSNLGVNKYLHTVCILLDFFNLCFECCVLSGKCTYLRQADDSSRRVLASVVCLSAIVESR